MIPAVPVRHVAVTVAETLAHALHFRDTWWQLALRVGPSCPAQGGEKLICLSTVWAFIAAEATVGCVTYA